MLNSPSGGGPGTRTLNGFHTDGSFQDCCLTIRLTLHIWGEGRGSNPQQPGPQSGALPIELPTPYCTPKHRNIAYHPFRAMFSLVRQLPRPRQAALGVFSSDFLYLPSLTGLEVSAGLGPATSSLPMTCTTYCATRPCSGSGGYHFTSASGGRA